MKVEEIAEELLDVSGIARLAQVSSSAVSNWITRHEGFPKPVIDKGHYKLYSKDEVTVWLDWRGEIVGAEKYCLDCHKILTDHDFEGSRETGHRIVVVKLVVT